MKSTFKLQGEGSMGTGFVIGRPSNKEPNKAYYVLVTAAHVLEKMQGDQAYIILRTKKDDGTYEKIPFPIKIRGDSKPLWVRHNEVDVAAMYVSLPKNIDMPLLAANFLVDDKGIQEFEIHPGDELMCLGYPLSVEGPEGFPILRSGKIASYPLLPTKHIKSFLLSLQIFEGNSGGPVYFVESGRTYKGSVHVSTIQFIAGLISEQYFATENIESLREKKEVKHPLSLAVVIHSVFIKETIDKLPKFD
jgi:hypothetical protein